MCFCLPVTLYSSFQGPNSFYPEGNLLRVLGEVYYLLFFLATKVGMSLRLWWTSCPCLNHDGRCRNESMSQNASILSPPWIFFSGWRYHNSSPSAKSVWVRTLCIRQLPFLLCQSLLRKAEPVEHTYLGLFATMVWPFVIVRVVQQSMGRCSFWVEGRKLRSAGWAVEKERWA